MKVKMKSPEKRIKGATVFRLQFEMETFDEHFRDNVRRMLLAGLDGGTVSSGGQEVEEKQSALGFETGGGE